MSIAMVTLLMVAVVEVVNGATSLIKIDSKKIDVDEEASAVFDRMAEDFAAMVKRVDVDYQFNNRANEQNSSSTLFFYSEAPAISATGNNGAPSLNSSCSLVGYRINSAYQLERLGKGLQWVPNPATSLDGAPDGMVYLTYASYPVTTTSTPVGGTLAATFPSVVALNSNDSNFHVLGDGVFRFAFWFLLKPFQNADGTSGPGIYSNYPYDTRRQHNSLTMIGLQDVQAIVVSLVMLDNTSRMLLPLNYDTSKLALQFADPSDPFTPITWEAQANGADLASATGIPRGAAAHVRVYQRTFNLVTPTYQ